MSDRNTLAGQIALITGASGGLGRHFAYLLANAGASVAACGRAIAKLAETAAAIEANGGRAVALEMDVTDCASIARSVAAAEETLGPIDILVNNSGVSLAKGATQISEAEYDRIMDTNPKGSFFVATSVARGMIARGKGGSIINLSSVAATRPFDQRSVYCMSKAAISHMTRVLALEWAKYGIRVNELAPGWIGTEVNLPFFETDLGRAYLQTFLRKRVGEPEHLDAAFMLLATPAGDFMTGASIVIDDGYSLVH